VHESEGTTRNGNAKEGTHTHNCVLSGEHLDGRSAGFGGGFRVGTNQHSAPRLGRSKNIPSAAVPQEQAHQNYQCKVRKERAKTWPKSFAKRRSQCLLRAKTFDTRFPDDTMVLEGHFLFKAVRGLN
jgi:hypothetical protein